MGVAFQGFGLVLTSFLLILDNDDGKLMSWNIYFRVITGPCVLLDMK